MGVSAVRRATCPLDLSAYSRYYTEHIPKLGGPQCPSLLSIAQPQPTGHDAGARREIVDEALLAEGAIAQIAVDLILGLR